jgi:hypothetical protein
MFSVACHHIDGKYRASPASITQLQKAKHSKRYHNNAAAIVEFTIIVVVRLCGEARSDLLLEKV